MAFRILTILAVVALALSTWFLGIPGRYGRSQGPAARPARPGYYLADAVLTDYDRDGAPSIRVAAGRIDQIGGGEEVALHDIRVDYQAPGGGTWFMVGDLAHIEPGGKTIDVSGNVRLEGAEPAQAGSAVITSPQMSYDVADEVVRTSEDVRIEFAAQSLTAHGLIADLKSRRVRLESRVNGRFVP
ncbi:MAG: LPS export ABC transporter periplasmic protein LptC [Gammaproteobacteria bacterium]|nr:LPS export ABC transporter periplasmic protein LptC [Gammaproteobacteria bacterium]